VLGIVYRVIATHLVRKAGHTHQAARTGAVTLIQRFGGALNLNFSAANRLQPDFSFPIFFH
jgi:hypothetical protein